jgi:hypothetical protein
MPRKSSSSMEAFRHPYLRKGFWLKDENKFWNKPEYSEQYRNKMNSLVETFYHRNSLLLNLINTK